MAHGARRVVVCTWRTARYGAWHAVQPLNQRPSRSDKLATCHLQTRAMSCPAPSSPWPSEGRLALCGIDGGGLAARLCAARASCWPKTKTPARYFVSGSHLKAPRELLADLCPRYKYITYIFLGGLVFLRRELLWVHSSPQQYSVRCGVAASASGDQRMGPSAVAADFRGA